MWIYAVIFIIVFLAGSIWAYYRYLSRLRSSGKPYKMGGDTLTFVFTLPLSFAIAEFVRAKLLMTAMPDGVGLTAIFIMFIVIANYTICLFSSSVAKWILKRKTGGL